ncbi:LacI family DNA-binding transcriptional regulator [Inquilinus limosus]|uniref:LacI family transcriptional regulator n=1 Tax=Inquilinus limosus TaxID=171674 RepID=A0A211ZUX9_9PROT|nr:LacI family DNA-binding transcriptional regulator [Inquilinus limosus]OWJ69098.1 LacI family transcriptional regulator [Inquilinus limosus]
MARVKARLKDIAAKTGYGVNTVSLALRGSTRISAAAREIISKAAEELDYVPNHFAKSLVSLRSNTVGLILHDVTNPILTSAAQMIQLALAERGYSVLFATSNGSFEEEIRAIEMFQTRMVDGILIYPLLHSRLDHLQKLRQRNSPIVLLVGLCETGIDAVGIDEFTGAYDATRHLIDRGHRRIGALIPEVGTPQKKSEGYLAALRAAGMEIDPALIGYAPSHTIESGIEAMDAVMSLADRPTAVFASSDVLALGALRWTRINDLAVPEQVAIAGFDNIDAARFAATPISTIDNNVGELARLAVARLLELIGSEGPLPPPSTTLLHGQLIVRESTMRRDEEPPVTRPASEQGAS